MIGVALNMRLAALARITRRLPPSYQRDSLRNELLTLEHMLNDCAAALVRDGVDVDEALATVDRRVEAFARLLPPASGEQAACAA